jgi:hypothetical protein
MKTHALGPINGVALTRGSEPQSVEAAQSLYRPPSRLEAPWHCRGDPKPTCSLIATDNQEGYQYV